LLARIAGADDHVPRAEIAGERRFALAGRDRHNVRAHRPGDLQRQVAETADAEHGHPLTGAHTRLLERRVHG
jgi:hypothetical protein